MSTWKKHSFYNNAAFKYILLTGHSPCRVTSPQFNNNTLTVPKENYSKKKRHNPDVPSFDLLQIQICRRAKVYPEYFLMKLPPFTPNHSYLECKNKSFDILFSISCIF